MHQYECHVWIGSQFLRVNVSGYTRAEAYQVAKAQFPAARSVSVIRQLD